jgi:acetyl-CoA C-acetyltransferase
VIGVATRTWRDDTSAAPEPLEMWEIVARAAADDACTRSGSRVLGALDGIEIVYTQTCQYDDPVGRLADRLGVAPRHRHYSGIGGTTPQVLVQGVADRILRGELDVALVCGAEALATQRRARRAGERPAYSFRSPEKRPFPWEAPFHPAEVAHEVFQAWLTFAVFDNARRAHRGTDLDEYRAELGAQWAPFTTVAAANPDAWFPVERSAEEIVTPSPQNRLVGYPYTKYMVSIMDVDMAAAVVLASDEAADRLGVPADRRVYLRGWCYATDPVYVAEHPNLWESPAMRAASRRALDAAGIGIDDVAHLDLYSCFASSVNFARDALGLAADDPRGLTVTGGLPYHGGAGSDYLTHSIATMARVLREDADSFGLVSGVGMHMTKHVFGVYSSRPGPVTPPAADAVPAPETVPIVDSHAGRATVAGYSVAHGSTGDPEWGLAVCDVPGGSPAARCYARIDDPDLLAEAERIELVGRVVQLEPDGPVNRVAGPAP